MIIKRGGNTVKTSTKNSIIGGVCVIISAGIGVFSYNIKSSDNTSEEYECLQQAYNELEDRYTNLENQNVSLQNELHSLNLQSYSLETINNNLMAEIASLKAQKDDSNNSENSNCNVQFRNVGLSIDGNNVPINVTNSSVIINNRTYYTDYQ